MVHCKQARKKPREPVGIPWTRGRARAAAVAARAPASPDPGYMRPTSSSCAREMAPTEREAVPHVARATCSSPHRHTAQTSAPRRSPPHRPRLRARRQPREPAQGAGEAGSSSLVGRRPSAQALRNLPDPLPPGRHQSPDTLRQPGIDQGFTCTLTTGFLNLLPRRICCLLPPPDGFFSPSTAAARLLAQSEGSDGNGARSWRSVGVREAGMVPGWRWRRQEGAKRRRALVLSYER